MPAISSKLADIPPDDYSWRKYGQKPIKGSPHPRYLRFQDLAYSYFLNGNFTGQCVWKCCLRYCNSLIVSISKRLRSPCILSVSCLHLACDGTTAKFDELLLENNLTHTINSVDNANVFNMHTFCR